MSNVIHLKAGEDLNKILKDNKAVIVDFGATWCGPCKELGPVLDKHAEEAAGKFKLVTIDVDENADLAEEYSVSSLPTVILFKDGKEVSQFSSFDKAKLDKMISSI